MTENICKIHVQDLGGRILITSEDEAEILFDPSNYDADKLRSILPLVAFGTYPLKYKGVVSRSGSELLVTLHDEGAKYEILIDGFVRLIKISWSK